ncbi:hypothetical protein AWB86_04295 [Riemerella anatipestifer]|nr:hypothetical protein AWB86_04295 [Riemerella anatipestifer]
MNIQEISKSLVVEGVYELSDTPQHNAIRQAMDSAYLQTKRSIFLGNLGLKSPSELWNGNEIHPRVLERAKVVFQTHIAGRGKSQVQVRKAIQDAIKACQFSPC